MEIPLPNCPRCGNNLACAYHDKPQIDESGNIKATVECGRCETEYTATWDVYPDPHITIGSDTDTKRIEK